MGYLLLLLHIEATWPPPAGWTRTVPNEKIYIHEFIDIIGHARAKYMHHMTAL